jgi:hypothetical protein
MLTEERLKHIAESELCEAHDEGTPCGVCDGILAARELLASRWTRITPENLPKVGDELLGQDIECGWAVLALDGIPESERDCRTLLRIGWTHFRPINAPREEQHPPRGGEEG